ncbi:ABC transporter substrate-binding protein [Sediminibacillus halophilus]|uniref:Arabinosaccharide transport system substrate-binding protein n=1 Tax=Sediminibacillus halophilus TaxID=482461 RepID=A0A1G9WZ88_9BACI|nr:sugar ABC transporter substrate-binding protein [Sediminibacillus halophilus]SDM89463.1 arabinosaccharide transport system substrate-binding protein [Sediminibacillus halophilus]
MKKYLLFILAVAFSILLTACGGNNKSSGGGGEANASETVGEDIEGATELTFWTYQEQHMKIFKSAAERWNEEYPDRPIKLVAETYPYDQHHNNLLMAMQSGSGGPDIADIEVGRFSNFLQGDIQLEPMNEYMEPLKDVLIPSRIDMYSKDGNYYGVPTHLGATVVYYNQEIMDEAGVDIDSIKTWDDYVEAGKQVVEKTGVPMTTVETDEHWSYWPLVSQSGSDFFDENGELILSNEKNVKTLQFLQDMVYESEIAVTAPGGFHHSEEYYGFMNDGGAASLMMPMWYMGRFIDYMPDLKGKMVMKPMPLWEGSDAKTAGMGGTGTVVTKTSDNVDLAKEFLAYAKLSEEGSIALWKQLGFTPVRTDVWDSPELQEDNEYFDYFGDYIWDMVSEMSAEVSGIKLTPYTADVITELQSNVMHSVIREKSQTPKEALKQAEESIRGKMEAGE